SLVILLRLLAVGIDLGPNAVHVLQRGGHFLVERLLLGLPFLAGRRQRGKQFLAFLVGLLAARARTAIELLAQPAGVLRHLGDGLSPAVVHGGQFGLPGLDLGVDLGDRRRFENGVGLAFRRDTGVHGLAHELALQKVRALVFRPGFFI